MTRVALLTLREGSLNKECNRQSEVLSPFNDLYVSIYFHLYRLWKSGQKTIADTGFVLKDVEDLAKKSPKTLLDNLRSHVESCKKKEVGSVEGIMNFMDVCAEEQ
ncbi:hypothetical protein CAPTEDRAFT_193492 [Capitella teleta]|uniref:Uncharacterized protein n=1 Tax=Capitella teleta TaxID=283909 RepID=R7T9N6_CAPTE|nr:hypothetical protein CAPTEDRAFT_193492 [Capitella teleta]|eukprot:ELT90409.1 hypothetical protein CAPTEDRAFT_193492 [Capitella teleta]